MTHISHFTAVFLFALFASTVFGITLTAPLTQPHLAAAQVAGSAATPGAPNHYDKRPN